MLKTILLSQTDPETVRKVNEIYEKVESLPDSGLRIVWVLSIVIAAAVIMIFLRQKKIAQNQVDLAKMMEELADKD